MIKLIATILIFILAVIILVLATTGCSRDLDQITNQDRAELNKLLEGI